MTQFEPLRYEPDFIPDLWQRWAVYDNDACDIAYRVESREEAHTMAMLLNVRAVLEELAERRRSAA